MFFSFYDVFSENFYILVNCFFSFFSKCSLNCRLKYRSIKTQVSGQYSKKICILIFIFNKWIDNYKSGTDIRLCDFHFCYPFLVCNKESSLSQIREVWIYILLVERYNNIHSTSDVWFLTTDMNIIIVESSLDNRLILTICDNMLPD